MKKQNYIQLYINCTMDGLLEQTKNKMAIDIFNKIKKQGMIHSIRGIRNSYDLMEDYFKEQKISEYEFKDRMKKVSYEYAKKNKINPRNWQLGYYLTNCLEPYESFETDIYTLDTEDQSEYLLFDITQADNDFINILKGEK